MDRIVFCVLEQLQCLFDVCLSISYHTQPFMPKFEPEFLLPVMFMLFLYKDFLVGM